MSGTRLAGAGAVSLVFVAVTVLLQRGAWMIGWPAQHWSVWVTPASLGTIACVVAIAALARLIDAPAIGRAGDRLGARLARRPRSSALLAIALWSGVVGGLVTLVLGRFANSADEWAYLFQAASYEHLRLWETPPALGETLIAYRTWIFQGKWVGQYPPGWPLVLAAGQSIGGDAATINAVLGGLMVACLFLLCRRIGGTVAACVVVALFALAPFTTFNAASYFSHILAAFLVVLLCACLMPRAGDFRARDVIFAGLLTGMIAATRYYSVLALAPSLLFWLATQPKRLWPRAVLCGAVGIAPVAALLMLYHARVTGSPFHTAYAVINTKPTVLAFDLVPLIAGTVLIAYRLAELALWASPVVVIVAIAALWVKRAGRCLAFYDLVFPGFVVAFIAFPDMGGNRYGPRYYFDAFPTLAMTIVSALPMLRARLPERPFLPAAALVTLLWLFATYPGAVTGFRDEVWQRQEPARLAAAQAGHDAIIILETPPGEGLNPFDLVRNPITMDAPILFARADADVAALRATFPQRSIWHYRRDDFDRPGRLTPVAP